MIFQSGLPETLCGVGSTVAATSAMRPELTRLLRFLEVKTLLDAPCGDFNWMSQADLSGIDYIGLDVSAANVAAATARESADGFAPKSKRVIEASILYGELPAADVMLCRDFLQHLPNKDVRRAISIFQTSDIEWFLVTSHRNEHNHDIGGRGDFRPLNLEKPPFSWPSPAKTIRDGANILGLWSRF